MGTEALTEYIVRRKPKVVEFRPVWLRRQQENKAKDLTGWVNGSLKPAGSDGAA